MKKNLFNFVGSIVGMSSIVFLFAGFVTMKEGSSMVTYKLYEYVAGLSYYSSGNASVFNVGILSIILIFGTSLTSFILSLNGILNDKDYSIKILGLSLINLLPIIYLLICLTIVGKSDSAKIEFGGIFMIAFVLIFCILSVSQFVSNAKKIEIEKAEDDSIDEFATIFKYKKMLDDGIITQDEFENFKKQILYSNSADSEIKDE